MVAANSQWLVPTICCTCNGNNPTGALRRRSSSLASVDHPNRPLTREHGGLMRWPENFYRPREQRKPNCEGTCRPANSLSARAMQQSIFGSMACSINIYLQRYVPKHLLGSLLVKKWMSGIFILMHAGSLALLFNKLIIQATIWWSSLCLHAMKLCRRELEIMACFIPTAFPVAEQVRLYVSKIFLKKLKQN